GIDLLRRLLADVAGVEEDEVGALRVVDRHVTGRRQRLRHPLGIVDVHLAAIGPDVDALQILVRSVHETRVSMSGSAAGGPEGGRSAVPLASFAGAENIAGAWLFRIGRPARMSRIIDRTAKWQASATFLRSSPGPSR